MLYRAHGSAILINPYINDRHVSEKEKLYPEEKQAIGIKAVGLGLNVIGQMKIKSLKIETKTES